MDNIETLASRFASLYPVARCWPEDGKLYVRYATGFSEYLEPRVAAALIRIAEERPGR